MLLGQKSLSTDESDSQKTYWLIQNTYYIKKTDGLTDMNFFFYSTSQSKQIHPWDQ